MLGQNVLFLKWSLAVFSLRGGERCGRHRVARLMRQAGLQGVSQRRQWRKKPSGPRPRATRNHLDRDFRAVAPNTKWVTDITDIRTAEHWLYLCVVLDL